MAGGSHRLIGEPGAVLELHHIGHRVLIEHPLVQEIPQVLAEDFLRERKISPTPVST